MMKDFLCLGIVDVLLRDLHVQSYLLLIPSDSLSSFAAAKVPNHKQKFCLWKVRFSLICHYHVEKYISVV